MFPDPHPSSQRMALVDAYRRWKDAQDAFSALQESAPPAVLEQRPDARRQCEEVQRLFAALNDEARRSVRWK
ncbi:MAG TPA: hypothetical protein VFO28_19575 [Burkholderiaceae bacterium]|nr:hypothetical protein [Burkholderiaceae bacterium]